MIRVALIDSNQLFRKSLSLLIETFSEVKVVFDTDDGFLLLEKLENIDFVDVVLLDIQMRKMDGYEICTLIKKANPNLKVLVVSQLTTKEAIYNILKCGANGFFTKNSPPELLEHAIRGVENDDYYFDMELAAIYREAILWQNKINSRTSSSVSSLTSREIEIIMMACKEMSSFEIGDKLCISSRTVEKHRKRIMEKTESKNFIGVVLYALKSNSIHLDDI